jgi:hypothetical protein
MQRGSESVHLGRLTHGEVPFLYIGSAQSPSFAINYYYIAQVMLNLLPYYGVLHTS